MSNIIDATGYNCPIPVLKARKAIKSIDAGEEIVVLASDPASAIDIPHFCNTAGHELLEQSEEEGVFRYLIRKIA
ncbi:MAG: sulfurtransferase TusA [Rhodospirillales bacterium]